MKFCDERIQKHLLNGGKIKRVNKDYSYRSIVLGDNSFKYADNGDSYQLDRNDLEADDWKIVEPKYNWNKIIKDKILCVFSDYEDYRTYVISPLIKVEDNNFSFKTIDELSYGHCKPFNPAEYNVAKNIKDYEEWLN